VIGVGQLPRGLIRTHHLRGSSLVVSKEAHEKYSREATSVKRENPCLFPKGILVPTFEICV